MMRPERLLVAGSVEWYPMMAEQGMTMPSPCVLRTMSLLGATATREQAAAPLHSSCRWAWVAVSLFQATHSSSHIHQLGGIHGEPWHGKRERIANRGRAWPWVVLLCQTVADNACRCRWPKLATGCQMNAHGCRSCSHWKSTERPGALYRTQVI